MTEMNFSAASKGAAGLGSLLLAEPVAVLRARLLGFVVGSSGIGTPFAMYSVIVSPFG
jgi:hypothetical protein